MTQVLEENQWVPEIHPYPGSGGCGYPVATSHPWAFLRGEGGSL